MKLIYILLFLSITQLASAQSRHTISIQSGVIHSFFDNTPLMNINYTSKDQGLFHGVFLGSAGLSYAYALNQKSSITAEATILANSYRKYRYEYPVGEKYTISRILGTFCLKYNRYTELTERTRFFYGLGASYRYGIQDVRSGPNISFCSTLSKRYQSNLGLTTTTGLQYQLNKRFSLYTMLDLRTVAFNTGGYFKNTILYDRSPNRFDLSLKVGLSFHF